MGGGRERKRGGKGRRGKEPGRNSNIRSTFLIEQVHSYGHLVESLAVVIEQKNRNGNHYYRSCEPNRMTSKVESSDGS